MYQLSTQLAVTRPGRAPRPLPMRRGVRWRRGGVHGLPNRHLQALGRARQRAPRGQRRDVCIHIYIYTYIYTYTYIHIYIRTWIAPPRAKALFADMN